MADNGSILREYNLGPGTIKRLVAIFDITMPTAGTVQWEQVTFRRIEVAPFEVERFGKKFGLIGRDCDDDDVLAVEVQPGNYMAFFEPWDSGKYDT